LDCRTLYYDSGISHYDSDIKRSAEVPHDEFKKDSKWHRSWMRFLAANENSENYNVDFFCQGTVSPSSLSSSSPPTQQAGWFFFFFFFLWQ
jgi:hypothetical protein